MMFRLILACSFVIGLSSCIKEREYTCDCTYTNENGEPVNTKDTFMSDPGSADEICKAESISTDTTLTCMFY